jgi:hypothetical protein
MVICPSIPVHLRMLAQLGYALRDRGLRELLKKRAADGVLLERIDDLDRLGAERPATRRAVK